VNPLMQLKQTTSVFLVAFGLACFALLPQAQAVVPAPDGGYPGGNTAEGQSALFSLTTGGYNTAIGYFSMRSNTTNSFNTAVGAGALFANTGRGNTAAGAGALLSNTTGVFNTATGELSLLSNTVGGGNTAVGDSALFAATGGSSNTAVGESALVALTTGNGNVAVGDTAGIFVTTANGVICISNAGANVSNTTWIGNIYGVTTQSGMTAPVLVSDEGQLGTVTSSERFKKDISAMDKTSEVILSLRPVTFHYKTDTKGTPQYGLIAEEVAKVNPALVLPDKEGKPYTVRYDQVNAMLLNEFLKEHKTVQEQQKEIDTLKAELKEQKTLIQKVSAQLELNKSMPQTVLNDIIKKD
jgi:Chaperone of endosialidase